MTSEERRGALAVAIRRSTARGRRRGYGGRGWMAPLGRRLIMPAAQTTKHYGAPRLRTVANIHARARGLGRTNEGCKLVD